MSVTVDFQEFSNGFHETYLQYKQLIENFKLVHTVLHNYNPQTLPTLRALVLQLTPMVVEDDRWLQRFATIISANDSLPIPRDFVLKDTEMYMFYYFLQREAP